MVQPRLTADSPLTTKQDAFARLLATGVSPAKAYLEAGYKDQGKNTHAAAYTLRIKPHIKARISYFRAMVAQKLDIRDEAIAAELAAIGFADIGELYDEHGDVLPIHELSPATRAAISEVTMTTTKDGKAQLRYKLADKVRAIEALAKLKGFMREHRGRVRVRLAIDKDGRAAAEIETDELGPRED